MELKKKLFAAKILFREARYRRDPTSCLLNEAQMLERGEKEISER